MFIHCIWMLGIGRLVRCSKGYWIVYYFNFELRSLYWFNPIKWTFQKCVITEMLMPKIERNKIKWFPHESNRNNMKFHCLLGLNNKSYAQNDIHHCTLNTHSFLVLHFTSFENLRKSVTKFKTQWSIEKQKLSCILVDKLIQRYVWNI